MSDNQSVIAKGSKSFYLASLFFSSPVRDAAWKLYRWCRYCDDQVDSAPNLTVALERLHNLRQQTLEALQPQTLPSLLTPEFQALREICFQYRIPQEYPLDLLQGFEMDASGKVYETARDLELYSYYVAGVVGLMMTRIFGASSHEASRHAVDLGTAMQLTNIARDIQEDFQMQRIYLPKNWLQASRVDIEDFLHSQNHQKIFSVVEKLLGRAQDLYRSGYAGLRYLPLRAALAVSIAGSIYSFIGWKIKRQQRFQSRTYVTLPEKVFLVFVGTFRILPLALKRVVKPWKSVTHFELWRPS